MLSFSFPFHFSPAHPAQLSLIFKLLARRAWQEIKCLQPPTLPHQFALWKQYLSYVASKGQAPLTSTKLLLFILYMHVCYFRLSSVSSLFSTFIIQHDLGKLDETGIMRLPHWNFGKLQEREESSDLVYVFLIWFFSSAFLLGGVRNYLQQNYKVLPQRIFFWRIICSKVYFPLVSVISITLYYCSVHFLN